MKVSTQLPLHALVSCTFLAMAHLASGAIVMFDEANSGDLSDDGATPTNLGVLSPGTSTVAGTMGGNPVDRDIFTFNVPAGAQLSSIDILGLEVTSGSIGGGSFFTAGVGATSDAPNSAGSFGFEITGEPGALFAQNFPAGPGDYTMWIQETAGGVVDYTIGITVVPEPSALALLGLTLAGLFRRRRP